MKLVHVSLFVLVLMATHVTRAQPTALTWESLPGPYGGLAVSVASTRTPSGQTAAVASDRYYLYRSIDGASQWERIREGSATLFAAPDGAFWALGNDVLRSIDYGLTWTPFAAGLPESGAAEMAASPDSTLYAATHEGLYRLDQGETLWRSTGLKEPVLAIASSSDGVLLAGTDLWGHTADPFSVQRSIDGGQTWTPVVIQAEADALVEAIAALPNGIALASGYGMYEEPGLFRSTDVGATWEPVPGFNEVTFEAFHLGPKGEVYADTRSLGSLHSDDGGHRWEQTSIDITDVADGPDGSILIATSRRGIVRSADRGKTVEDATEGFGRVELAHVVLGRQQSLYVASPRRFVAGGDFHRSMDAGETWERVPLGFIPNGANDLHYTTGGALLLAPGACACVEEKYKGGRLYRSVDDGDTWIDVAPDTLGDDGEIFRVYSLHEHTDGTLWMLADTEGKKLIYRSTTEGVTWEQRTPAPITVGAFTIAPDGTLWIAADQSLQDGVGVYRSTNQAETWAHVTTLAANRAGAILVTPSDHIIVSALYPDFYSPDGGETWAEIDLALKEVWHEVDTFVRNESGVLFGGVDDVPSIIRSLDDGATWEPVVSGLPSAGSHYYTDLALDDTGHLWAALGAYGLYRTRESTLVGTEREMPRVHSQLIVYPNPVREVVTIKLDLIQTESHVELAVYDMQGRRVRVLVSGPLYAGDHLHTFSAAGLPAGVYVLRAKGEHTTMVARLVVTP